MKTDFLTFNYLGSAPSRYALLGTASVVAGAAGGTALYFIEPRAILFVLLATMGVVTLGSAVAMPGVVLAAYLCTPFYKAGLQPLLPLDLTVGLAMLNAIQFPIFLASGEPSGFRLLKERRIRYALILWFALTALVLVGVLRAPDTNAAMSAATNWILLLFLPGLGAVRTANERRFLHQFLWTLFFIGTLVTLVGLWILPQVGEWPNDRLRVFGAHTIRVGQAAVLVPLVAIPFGIRARNGIVRFLSVALIPAALLVAASSGSRGPLLMLFLTAGLFSLRRLGLWTSHFRQGRASFQPIRVIIPVIFMMLILLMPLQSLSAFVPKTSLERLGTLSTILGGLAGGDLADEAPDNSTADRLFAHDLAEDMFLEQPFVGHGTFSFGIRVYRQELQLVGDGTAAHPHNLVLQLAAEHGVVGVGLLAVVVGTALWRGFRLVRSPEWTTLTIICVFFLLCAMVSTEMVENRMLWGLLLILMLAPDPDEVSA